MESAVSTANSNNFNIHCHTHKHKKCNSLNIEVKQQLVETIFQKQEEKWVKSVKKLVSDIKDEILTEINNTSACALKNCSQSSCEEGSSTETISTDALSFPLTLSELEDSSEVEYDLNACNENYKNYDECDNSIGKKRKFGFEKIESCKRQRSDDSNLETYSYDTPTHIYSSSPLKRNLVAKALSFSSCSESDDSVIITEAEDGESNKLSPRKRWTGMASLDKINESPEIQDKSGDSELTLDLKNVNSRNASPDSVGFSESSDLLSPLPDNNLDNSDGQYTIFSDEDSEAYGDPFDDVPATVPSFRMYEKEFKSKLGTILEEDEDESDV